MKEFLKKNAGLLFYLGDFIGIAGMILVVFKRNTNLYLIYFLFFIPSLVLMFPKFLILLRKEDKGSHEGNLFVITILTFLVYLVVPIKTLYEYLMSL